MAGQLKNNVNQAEKTRVVVTGFGLFRDHTSNPSWDAISDGKFKIDRENVEVITKRVNVSYEEVDTVVDDLWRKYDPTVMVHVGLAAHENRVRIETIGRHGPYIHNDVAACAPHKDLRNYVENIKMGTKEENIIRRNYTCKPCDFGSSRTCFDVDRICERLSKLHAEGYSKLDFKKSEDAGLYVCEYIYQKSLRICDRSIFIHVPDTSRYSIEEIRQSIQLVIETILDDFNEIS